MYRKNILIVCACALLKKIPSRLIISLLLILCGTVYGGKGKIEDGKFTLYVTIDFNANSATIDALRVKFQEASELLYDATEGRHQFGTILVGNNSRGKTNADIVILSSGKTYVSDACTYPDPGLGRQICKINIDDDKIWDTTGRHVIVHEFGHYGYGILDEYRMTGNNTPAECLVGIDPAPACLMERYELRDISEFCAPINHDKDDPSTSCPENDNTDQQTRRHVSCWSTMASCYAELAISADSNWVPEDTPPAPGAEAIDWIVLQPATRMIVVIDRSQSMGFNTKLTKAMEGAKLFVDLMQPVDELGIVSFSNDAMRVFELQSIDTDIKRNAAKSAIDGILLGDTTNTAAGLDTAYTMLTTPSAATQQVIVLITDLHDNTGNADFITVVNKINSAAIITHTIAFEGPVSDILSLPQHLTLQTQTQTLPDSSNITAKESLVKLARGTFGRSFFVDKLSEMQFASTGLSAESGENTGIVASIAQFEVTPEQIMQKDVLIDSLAKRASFALNLTGFADTRITLLTPSEEIITSQSAIEDTNITFFSDSLHKIINVISPQPGVWRLSLDTDEFDKDVRATANVLVVNPHISFTVTPDKPVYTLEDTIRIAAVPKAPVNVVGANITGTVERPDGSIVPLGEIIDSDQEDGFYTVLFSDFVDEGDYAFEFTVENSDGVLYSGEALFADPDSGFVPPQGPVPVRAPAFTRNAGFTVTVRRPSPPVREIVYGVDEDKQRFVQISVRADTIIVSELGRLVHGPSGRKLKDMEAMTWDPFSKKLWVISNKPRARLFGVDRDSIPDNPGSAEIQAELIGNTEAKSITGIAVHPETGILYGIDQKKDVLLKIDKTTGKAKSIGKIGFEDVEGLAFSVSEPMLLYGSDNKTGKLITINIKTGKGQAVHPHNKIGFPEVESLAFRSDGTLIGYSDNKTDKFIRIDPKSGKGVEFTTRGLTQRLDIQGLGVIVDRKSYTMKN